MAHQHLVPLDATFEFRHAKASLWNKTDGVDWLRFLEGKGAMDEVYKAITVDEKPCPREVKIETDDTEENKDQHDDRGKARNGEENRAHVPLDNSHCRHKKVKQNR